MNKLLAIPLLAGISIAALPIAAEAQSIRCESSSRVCRDSDGDRRSKCQIVIETEDGKSIKFGSSLKEERMKFVAAAVRHALFSPAGR